MANEREETYLDLRQRKHAIEHHLAQSGWQFNAVASYELDRIIAMLDRKDGDVNIH